jgi:hypothetical protein
MPRSIGNQIPETIRPLFEGTDLEAHEGLTFLLLTASDQGWPYLAMLSVGEVLATDDRHLRIALWAHSTSTANLTRESKATLALVYDKAGYYLRITTRRGDDLKLPASGTLAYFEATVEDVQEDVAPYAVLESGVTYKLKKPEDVFPRWYEAIEALRSLSP